MEKRQREKKGDREMRAYGRGRERGGRERELIKESRILVGC